ncbi:phosphate ABC transporter permease subunit PstA/phosphate ABC transporter permease protein PstC,TIGR02138 [Dongia mobilis]|uniref:Phosphate transport system permease protein n=1 Tax=Dongia mobilis TaxID=578943 RepID=A0A4R6X2W7_9PROT|nr:phosphate ABC transporter permease subunit PstA/phosphate ABC transporter permease protein PstC,TIGR02138 [Dongia mobilis]
MVRDRRPAAPAQTPAPIPGQPDEGQPPRGLLAALAVALSLVLGLAAPAQARDQIHIVGSSTVYPFSTAVAEHFGSGEFRAPVVEASGTGGGFKLFCAGLGANTPDIANASRQIKDSEVETCRANGVTEIVEIEIGYDGIVLASSKQAPSRALNLRDLYLALAKTVPVDGALVPNPYRSWNEINPALPAARIEVLGPPPTSGTRDAFLELVMEPACHAFPEVAAIADKNQQKALCQTLREDGAYIDAGENDNLIVQKLSGNPAAFGILGYSFLADNLDRLQGSAVDGVAPTEENIIGGAYRIARKLYIYVKKQHLELVPGLGEFVAEFVSDRASGPQGYLADKGMIPMPAPEHDIVAAAALAALPIASSLGAGLDLGPAAALLPWGTVALLLILSSIGFQLGRRRAFASVGGRARQLHSLPGYHGIFVGLGAFLPGALALLAGVFVVRSLPAESSRDVIWAAIAAATFAAAAIGLAWAQRHISAQFRARNAVERAVMVLLIVCSLLSILTTIGIVLSLVFEALRFFATVSPFEFLFGLQWSPQMAIRADQVGQSGAFGAVPVFAGTMLITIIAMAVAVPIGLMAAIYLSDYAGKKTRSWAKPLIEILAGIPTVVYGFFAALTVAPLVRNAGNALGLDVASESALAAGLVMGVMIIPFISSLSDDVMNAVPQSLRDGAYALGATKSETIRQVVVPAALPGIMGGILLAVSRAIGETMIVVMAAGLTARLTANPLDAVTTVTVQIVTLLVGDQEFDSPKTLAAFALGLVLFVVTLILNIVALHIVKKYREQYE